MIVVNLNDDKEQTIIKGENVEIDLKNKWLM
ncbi:MAG: hypothetical protein H6Q70_3760 [Firmicutes bacterium]|nr:hypothetical protein [Bacillota bacterium]